MKIPHAVWGSGGIKFGRILAVAAFFFAIPIAASAGESVTLAWLPSPSPNAIGYKLYYGLSTGSYTTTVDVGNVTSNVVSALATGATYYFSATAYDATGNESPHCTEISYRTPSALSVTWANPADIVYGTTLGPQQLNATATVAGTFVYNPPPGTVLSAGTGQKLTAIFVPDDQVTYGPVTNSAQINVQRAPLQVVADNKSNVYGASLPTLTATWTGFVNGDTVASLTTPIILGTPATLSSGVGSYAITASGASSPNYTISFTGSALSITPATLSVTADVKTKTYGAADPALTFTVSGLKLTDTQGTVLTGGLTRTAGESVAGGPYAITPGTLAANANYTISFTGNALSITPATLSVTADVKTKTYSAADPALTLTVSGLQFTDTQATVLTGGLTRAAGESVAGSPYAITRGTLAANANYTISFTGNALSITAATGSQLVSIALSPYSATLSAGQTSQLTATGTYSDGTKQNLTTTVSWSSYYPTVATVNSSGLVTAMSSGYAWITASWGGITGLAGVTVTQTVAPTSVSDVHPVTLQIARNPEGQGGVIVTLSGVPGTRCGLQVTTDLVHWESIFADVLSEEPLIFIDSNVSAPSIRFYRVLGFRND